MLFVIKFYILFMYKVFKLPETVKNFNCFPFLPLC